jgi:hypothetical protein
VVQQQPQAHQHQPPFIQPQVVKLMVSLVLIIVNVVQITVIGVNVMEQQPQLHHQVIVAVLFQVVVVAV